MTAIPHSFGSSSHGDSHGDAHAQDGHGHAHHEIGFMKKYFFSIDHKVIGLQFLFFGLASPAPVCSPPSACKVAHPPPVGRSIRRSARCNKTKKVTFLTRNRPARLAPSSSSCASTISAAHSPAMPRLTRVFSPRNIPA